MFVLCHCKLYLKPKPIYLDRLCIISPLPASKNILNEIYIGISNDIFCFCEQNDRISYFHWLKFKYKARRVLAD